MIKTDIRVGDIWEDESGCLCPIVSILGKEEKYDVIDIHGYRYNQEGAYHNMGYNLKKLVLRPAPKEEIKEEPKSEAKKDFMAGDWWITRNGQIELIKSIDDDPYYPINCPGGTRDLNGCWESDKKEDGNDLVKLYFRPSDVLSRLEKLEQQINSKAEEIKDSDCRHKSYAENYKIKYMPGDIWLTRGGHIFLLNDSNSEEVIGLLIYFSKESYFFSKNVYEQTLKKDSLEKLLFRWED